MIFLQRIDSGIINLLFNFFFIGNDTHLWILLDEERKESVTRARDAMIIASNYYRYR